MDFIFGGDAIAAREFEQPKRTETGKVQFVTDWEVRARFLELKVGQQFHDTWDYVGDDGIIKNPFESCATANVGEWIAGPLHYTNLFNPERSEVNIAKGPWATRLLGKFTGIDVDDYELCKKRIARFATKYGLLGKGVVGVDPTTTQSPTPQNPQVFGLLEPVALWRLEARAVKLMRSVHQVAMADTEKKASQLVAEIRAVGHPSRQLSKHEDLLCLHGARALFRVQIALQAEIQSHPSDVRGSALRTYAKIINGVLAQHSRLALSVSPYTFRVEVSDAYGLLYYALSLELPLKTTGRLCARLGCDELIPPGSHRDTKYCGKDYCTKARYRERKRQSALAPS